MKSHNLFLFFFAVIITAGCTNKTADSDQVKKITFEKKPVEFVKLSDFVTSIDYIQLETKSASYINDIKRIRFFGDTIIIFNEIAWNMVEMQVYNRAGKFLGLLGSYGQGPEEIQWPKDVLISGESIIVLDRGRVVEFDRKGNFRGEIFKVNLPGHSFFSDSGKFYFYHASIYPGLFSEYDTTGKLVKVHYPYPTDRTNSSVSGESVNRLNGEIHLFAPALDTVWAFRGNQLAPQYVFGFTEGTTMQKFFNENRGKSGIELIDLINSTPMSQAISFIEDDNYIYLNYYILKKGANKLIAKKDGKELDFTYCDNDIDNGLFGHPVALSDGCLVSILEPLEIKKVMKGKNLQGNTGFAKMYESLKEDDNPILMFCKLK